MTNLNKKVQETIQEMASSTAEAGAETTRSKSGPRRRKRWRTRHPLRELRLVRGFTLEELAEQTDLSPSYLSRLESGSRRLNADIMGRLATALNCHPGELLQYGENFTASNAGQAASNQNTQSHNLPLYRLTKSESGAFKINFSEQSEFAARPPELQEASKSYAIALEEDTFAPRYYAGERLLTHPTKALTPRCSVAVVTTSSNALIAQFIGWRAAETGAEATGPVEANSDDLLVLAFTTPETDASIYKSIDNVEVEGQNVLIKRRHISNISRIIGAIETA